MQLRPATGADYRLLRRGSAPEGLTQPPGGVEPDATLDMLIGWSDRLIAAQGWGTWLIIRETEIVGSMAVKDPPDANAMVEIGYAVAPARRKQGIATAAVGLLLTDLRRRTLRVVTAETSIANPASARVLQANLFEKTGQRNDPEDGLCNLWRRLLV